MKKATMKANLFKWLCLVGYIVCAIVLIVESCMNGTQSANQSNVVGGTVAGIVNDLGGDQAVIIKPKEVNITNKIELGYVGETYQINSQIKPENSTYQSLIYTSSNETVATISAEGLVTFLKKGNVKIEVTSANYVDIKDSIDIEVLNVEATEIECELNADKVVDDIYFINIKNNNYHINTTIKPSNTTIQNVLYACDETKYLSINQNGDISPLQYSENNITTITISLGNLTQTLKVIVDMDIIELKNITVDKPNNSIYPTQLVTPKITFEPNNATFKEYKLISSNTSIVSISSKSYKGVKAGQAIVNIVSTKYSEIVASINVTVLAQPQLQDFTPSITSFISVGTKSKIGIKNIKPQYASINSIVYTSLDTNIATVDKSGNVYGVNIGKTKIILSDANQNFKNKEIEINITERPNKEDYTQDFEITYLKGNNPYVLNNQTIDLKEYFVVEKFIYPEEHPTIKKDITYTINKASTTALYEELPNQQIKTKSNGVISITITHNASKISKVVTINVIHDFYVLFDNDTDNRAVIYEGKSANFEIVSANDSHQTYMLSLSNDALATIQKEAENSYVFNAISAGEVVITITPYYDNIACDNLSKTIIFNILNIFATYVEITGYNETLKKDISFIETDSYEMYLNDEIVLYPQFDPKATIKDLSFISSNPEILKIDNSGRIKAEKAGNANITLIDKYSNCQKVIHFTIKNFIKIENISVRGEKASYDEERKIYSITNGYSGAISLNFSDDTTYRKVTYQSSDENIIIVGKDGKLTPVKAGVAKITMECDDGMIATPIVQEITIEVKRQDLIQDLSKFFLIVRKSLGHFGAFLAFGICSTLTYLLFFKKKQLIFSIPFNFLQGFLLACLTEYIQLHVPGRSGLWSDVVIDFTGFICSAAIITIGMLIMYYIKYKKQKNLNETISE